MRYSFRKAISFSYETYFVDIAPVWMQDPIGSVELHGDGHWYIRVSSSKLVRKPRVTMKQFPTRKAAADYLYDIWLECGKDVVVNHEMW